MASKTSERKPANANEKVQQWLDENPEADSKLGIYAHHRRLVTPKEMHGKGLKKFAKYVLDKPVSYNKGCPFTRTVNTRDRLREKLKAQQFVKEFVQSICDDVKTETKQ